MTNNIRVFLWLGLALALWVNYSQWQLDYGAKADAAGSHDWHYQMRQKPRRIERHCSAGGSVKLPPRPGCRRTRSPLPASARGRAARPASLGGHGARHHRRAGARHRLARRHAGARGAAGLSHGQGTSRSRWCCSTRPTPRLTTCCRPASRARAGQRAPDAPRDVHQRRRQYQLAAGQDELRVPLTWTDGSGITVTKTYVFHRSMFAIGLEYSDARTTPRQPWKARLVRAASTRVDPPIERSMFKVEIVRHSAARRFSTRTARSTSELDIEDVGRPEPFAGRDRTAGSPACSITSSARSFPSPADTLHATR